MLQPVRFRGRERVAGKGHLAGGWGLNSRKQAGRCWLVRAFWWDLAEAQNAGSGTGCSRVWENSAPALLVVSRRKTDSETVRKRCAAAGASHYRLAVAGGDRVLRAREGAASAFPDGAEALGPVYPWGKSGQFRPGHEETEAYSAQGKRIGPGRRQKRGIGWAGSPLRRSHVVLRPARYNSPAVRRIRTGFLPLSLPSSRRAFAGFGALWLCCVPAALRHGLARFQASCHSRVGWRLLPQAPTSL